MTSELIDRDLRQRELVPPEKLQGVVAVVVGVGAVGRQAALQLAALGAGELVLIDHDVVDIVNLAPQGYAPAELGRPKVLATAECCRRLNPEIVIHAFPERFRRSGFRSIALSGPEAKHLALFCCVDSIETRRIIWDAVKSATALFIDARMNGEIIRVLACEDPPRDQHYAATLFAAREAYAGACTARSTIYTASIAAGLMLGQFTRWLRQLPVDRDLLLNLLAAELSLT